MKSKKIQFLPRFLPFLLLLAISSLVIVSCGDDEEPGGGTTTNDPISSFQFEISDSDWKVVSFSNFSDNASTYAWDFGDSNSSTEESPTHTYAAGGIYEVTLTASEGSASKTSSKTVTITDPNEAIKILAGDVSKTWKLFREGTSMSLGAGADNAGSIWSGLTNDGSRPCLYEQEFTFNTDGSYDFDDKGSFWAEYGIFNNVAGCDQNIIEESCFEATAANMVNACGDDVSAWLTGTHSFDYDPSTGFLTLTGTGPWIGIPKLGTTGESTTPLNSVTTKVSFEEFAGYDVMLVEFIYLGSDPGPDDDNYWPIKYVSYSDASLEPELVTVSEPPPPFGEDLPDVSPTSLMNDFSMPGSIDTIESGSIIDYGVDDPAGGTAVVGQFIRPAVQYQELKMQTSPTKNDINFENLTSISVDVYFPDDNDYSGSLTRGVIIGFADASATEQWWTDHQQYEWDGTNAPIGEWVTITFDISQPNTVANSANGLTPYDRNDYDMIFLQIGGGDHTDTGTFFVRNLVIN